jgi:hypothetical protein
MIQFLILPVFQSVQAAKKSTTNKPANKNSHSSRKNPAKNNLLGMFARIWASGESAGKICAN